MKVELTTMKIMRDGWCEKGKRFYGKKPGKRRERLSIIGALCQGEFFAPLVYQGYCNTQLIEAWLSKCLLPKSATRAGDYYG